MFHQIAILGAGLLGASLLQAARERGLALRLTAWSRREQTRVACAGQPWCDAVYADPGACVRGADLVVACVPVDQIPAVLAQVAPMLADGALITDVGSTKRLLCRDAAAAVAGRACFVGSHPMAGSEKSGPAHARADLFEGRVCFVTPEETAPEAAVARVEAFWRALGMQVTRTTAAAHDEIAAHVSHLPHLVSAALAAALEKRPSEWGDFAGAGLWDTTRVAGGDPGMWQAILRDNKEDVLSALALFQAELDGLGSALQTGDFAAVEDVLSRGKRWRLGLEQRKSRNKEAPRRAAGAFD